MDGKDVNMIRSVGLTLANAFMSIWCVLHNKYVVDPHEGNIFPLPNCLAICQSLFTITCLLSARFLGLTNDPRIGLTPPAGAKSLFVIAIMYVFNVMFGLMSLEFLTVPMYSVLKRGTIPATFVGEYLFLSSSAVGKTLPSIVVMLAGSVVAGYYDLHFSFFGYLFGTLSCASQAASFIFSKKFAATSADAEWGIVYFNSVVSVMAMVPFVFLYGEHTQLWDLLTNTPSDAHPYSLLFVFSHICLNGLSVLALNYFIFANCNNNSPLTVGITGQLKAILQIFFGILLFGKTPGYRSGVGVVLNCVGSVVRVVLLTVGVGVVVCALVS
jgi:solute carrier family 35 protein